MAGTNFQFTIRRANPRGITPLKKLERYKDRRPSERRADALFVGALIEHFECYPFERGNLDAGRLNWLFEREVKPHDDPFDPKSYEAKLILDLSLIQSTFWEVYEKSNRDIKYVR
tara:strand:+ start:173 stop:517 length:345 start_codon:yes stop_codon:yes gene_type:complete